MHGDSFARTHQDGGQVGCVTEAFIAAFTQGWKEPSPHIWDNLLAEDVELVQPLMPTRRGREALAEEYGRLLALVPDLQGEVRRWWQDGSALAVEMTLTGTLGTSPLSITLIDRLDLDDSGRIATRRAYFDPTPAILTLARQPRAWIAWWRSGLGPLLGRRRLLKQVPQPNR